MKFGSVCSGIEAASVAWHPLGWKASWLAEIEPFPSAVLAHHYPDVPNLGDMTKIADMVTSSEVDAPDVLVGGTPCQAFSVAGLRNGLSDDRGFLTIKFVELADAIDNKRKSNGLVPAVVVWENVPGVLSSKDNAFGCFLAGLAGEDEELQPPGGKWTNAGCVSGPSRTVAWRILDAQYFGVAQRRRRVFVVASAREGFNPAEVLFEFDGLRRDSAPSRQTREEITTATGTSTAVRSHWDGAQHPHPTLSQSHNTGGIGQSNQELFSQRGAGLVWPAEIACTLNAAFGSKQGLEDQHVNGGCPLFVPAISVVHGTQDPCVSENLAFTLGRNNGGENAVAYGIPGNWIGRAPENGGNATEPMHNVAPCQTVADRHGVAYGMQVRRLTPTECERLQGFPDNYTLITVKGKPSPDGGRYKALGNSMAVPVMRWIGERIRMHSSDQ